jgi:hypothetical protein
VSKVVLLDACTLGMISNPNDSQENVACQQWAVDLSRRGTQVRVPEIADYEVRRELIRANKTVGMAELDRVIQVYAYVPLCTRAMRLAAQFWADARAILGKATARAARLDADMIVCAQAKIIELDEGVEVVIATTNIKHMVFAKADEWQNIGP